VFLLQLLDEGLDVGRDYIFRGVLFLLLLFEVLGKRGGGGGLGVHGRFLLGVGL
jgi:hypothetical protein